MIRQADTKLKSKWQAVFARLPDDSKQALKSALELLRKDASERAQYCWKKHKAPMALYWKVVGVYAGHLAKSISTTGKPQSLTT